MNSVLNIKNLIFSVLILLQSIGVRSQSTYHVFSAEIPWKQSAIVQETGKIYSITEAIGKAVAGDSIVIHEGIYREKVTVNKNNLKLKNYQNDYVLVTGAQIVTGWKQSADMAAGIYEADVTGVTIETPYTQLFANGEIQMMARHPNNITGKMMDPMNPNSGFASLSSVYKDAGTTGKCYATLLGTTLPNVDLTGGVFRSMSGKTMNYVYGTITASSGNSVTFSPISNGIWKADAAIKNTYFKFGYGFVMHKNLIDMPGEWFLSNKKLYLMPPTGVDMNSARIEIQVREKVLVLNNTTGVTIKGVNFVAGNTDMQTTGSATIQGCTMRYLYPFWAPTGYGQGDTDTKGIYLNNSSNNTFKDNYIGHTWGNVMAFKGGQNNTVQNCVIEDFGWVGVFTSGVHVSGSDNTNILNCTFGDAARFQVRMDGNDAKVSIMDCDFYGSMKMGEDAGPIEATSTGKIGALSLKGGVIAYNKVHDVKGVPVSDANYLRVKATAFYMEDTQNYTAHHNLIYNIKHEGYTGSLPIEKVGEFLYMGPRYNAMYEPVNYYNNTVWNIDENISIWNIVINNWKELGIVPPDTTGFMRDGHFANNIFMNGPSYKMSYVSQVLTATGGTVSYATAPAGSSISTVDFNDFTTHCAEWGYQFNPRNNEVFSLSAASANFTDAANGDFSLTSNSAAKSAGVEIPGITASTTPDCGALEGSNRVLFAGATLGKPNFYELTTNNTSVSVNKALPVFNLKVFPNPAKNLLNISVNNMGLNHASVAIYSMVGNLVRNRVVDLSTGNAQIDISTLKSGVYILKIENYPNQMFCKQ